MVEILLSHFLFHSQTNSFKKKNLRQKTQSFLIYIRVKRGEFYPANLFSIDEGQLLYFPVGSNYV